MTFGGKAPGDTLLVATADKALHLLTPVFLVLSCDTQVRHHETFLFLRFMNC
jgi:hypothetical protein